MNENLRSRIRLKIISDLEYHPESLARQISNRIGVNSKEVSYELGIMVALGLVSDIYERNKHLRWKLTENGLAIAIVIRMSWLINIEFKD
jgi:predicted transcriptional regulator